MLVKAGDVSLDNMLDHDVDGDEELPDFANLNAKIGEDVDAVEEDCFDIFLSLFISQNSSFELRNL